MLLLHVPTMIRADVAPRLHLNRKLTTALDVGYDDIGVWYSFGRKSGDQAMT